MKRKKNNITWRNIKFLIKWVPFICFFFSKSSQDILKSTEKLLQDKFNLIAAARLLVNDPNNKEKQEFFDGIQKEVITLNSFFEKRREKNKNQNQRKK